MLRPSPALADMDGDTILSDGLSDIDDDLRDGTDDEERSRRHNSARTRTRMTSSEAEAQLLAQKQYKQCQMILLFTTWMMSLIVATVKFYSRPGGYYSYDTGWGDWGDNTPVSGGNNGLKDEENQVRFRQTLEYLISSGVTEEKVLVGLGGGGGKNGSSGNDQIDVDDFGAKDDVKDSPQLRAARWISTFDRRALPIPKPKTDTTSGLFDGDRPNSAPKYDKHEYPFLQRYALATLFFSTGGGDEQWNFTTGFLSSWHECVWFDIFDIEGMASDPNTKYVFGVICDGEPNLSDEEEEGDLVGGKPWVVTHVSLPREYLAPPFMELFFVLFHPNSFQIHFRFISYDSKFLTVCCRIFTSF